MNIIDTFVEVYTRNQKEMMEAIFNAGGTPTLIMEPEFVHVLRTLSQNNIDIRCLYVKES